MEMEWKWNGNGMEMEWLENNLKVCLGIGWKCIGNLLKNVLEMP